MAFNSDDVLKLKHIQFGARHSENMLINLPDIIDYVYFASANEWKDKFRRVAMSRESLLGLMNKIAIN